MDLIPRREEGIVALSDRTSRHVTVGSLAMALARSRKWDECAILARRWLDEDVASTDAALFLLNALKAPGTPEAYRSALEEYTVLERRLARDHGRPVAPEVGRLASSIRDELARISAASPPEPTVSAPPPDLLQTEPTRSAGGVRGVARSRFASVSVAAALFVGATSFSARGAASRPAHDLEVWPSIAVVDVQTSVRDSAFAWLEAGFPKMVSSGLGRIPGVEVIPAERIYEARQAFGIGQGVTLSAVDVARLGARSGARWAVSASITPGDSVYALRLTVQDTADPRSTHLFTLTSPSLLALADEAAATLASVATTTSGPSAPAEFAFAGRRRPY